MYLSPKCCVINGSSSGSSSSSPPDPPVEIEETCGGVCIGRVMPRNYRVTFNWPAPIYPGEAAFMSGPGSGGLPVFSVRSFGGVCTGKYNTGGWTLMFSGSASPFGGCAWKSDEKLGLITYDAENELGYPATCVDTADPLAVLTLGEPGLGGSPAQFRLYINAPVAGTRSDGTPELPTSIEYVGGVVDLDGNLDCLSAQELTLTTPLRGQEAWLYGGAFYDHTYWFDPNGIFEDSDPPVFRVPPPLPLTVTVTPA